MPKKDPSYETGWHTTGNMDVLPSVEQVAKRVAANKHVILHEPHLDTKVSGGWWSYDAVWVTPDGAQVRGRLNVHDVKPGATSQRQQPAIEPHEYDPADNPRSGFFHAYAKADRPWNPAWPSPLSVFLDRKSNPRYASLEYVGYNLLHPRMGAQFAGLLSSMTNLKFAAIVVTHDDMDLDRILGSEGLNHPTPLISRLPPSLYGRVIDVRIMGESMRKDLNRTLVKYGTELPSGGAAIVLSPERRKGLRRSDLSFPMNPSFMKLGDIGPLSSALSRLLTSGVLVADPEAIQELEADWNLMTDTDRVKLMDSAADRLEELEKENEKLLSALKESKDFIEKFKASGENLLAEMRESKRREEEARESERKLRRELDRALCMIRDSDLGREMAAREAAEEEVELAEELLDAQQHDVRTLRQEVSSLRRELARLNSTFELTHDTVQESAPETWDEFFARATSLEYVVLGPVHGEVDKLRGHTSERRWIQRSWEALQALEEYARMKKERGVEEVPHFHAYLSDPRAECVIPSTRYSKVDSKGVMMNSRFVAARTLPVPREVDPSGRIVMEAHIRIGSGKPPAPRMHLHDDTSGETGKIYIGHLGPHLPNYQTN